MSRLWLVLSFATVSGSGYAQVPADLQKLFEVADRQVIRLQPTAFAELPKNLIAELQRRGCTIPQVPMIEGLHNVIKGEFARPGQTDWAVLCSIGRVLVPQEITCFKVFQPKGDAVLLIHSYS